MLICKPWELPLTVVGPTSRRSTLVMEIITRLDLSNPSESLNLPLGCKRFDQIAPLVLSAPFGPTFGPTFGSTFGPTSGQQFAAERDDLSNSHGGSIRNIIDASSQIMQATSLLSSSRLAASEVSTLSDYVTMIICLVEPTTNSWRAQASVKTHFLVEVWFALNDGILMPS